jgi:UDP-N-acetylglucosamine 4,6-dehydratase/5-epimerase
MSSNAFYQDKTVLITGGAGSVGSQLVRNLLGANPRAVILLDNNEGALYDLEQDLKSRIVSTVIADIKDKERMEQLFDEGVDFVFHLAGLKNVPMCEYNPYEAVKTNVVATHNLIDLSLHERVEKLIFPSTGKAVKPTTVYGATKLLAERLLTLANSKHGPGTIFASVRFGNVLGSRGSIFPLFKRQIENGGPVTITHEEMVRPRILMSNALRLIMGAGELAIGGETFIFKMKVMKIAEVADVMIDELAPASGYKPDEIDVKLIGIKPGEKIREQLMTESEQRRAYESEDMFVVAPEMKDLSHVREFYSSLAARGEINAYEPRDATFVTREEIKEILKHLGYT